MKIILKQVTDSTNDDVKQYIPLNENIAVCAQRQTGGRGTKGRSFCSEEGGLYISVLTFYEDLTADRAFEIMTHAAVSVCKTACDFGVKATIKWPNDVFVGAKKLCGILIENKVSEGKVRYSVVGMGINVCNDLTSLGGIATSLFEESGKKIDVEEVRNRLIEHYESPSTFEEYSALLKYVGERVTVMEGYALYEANVLGVLPDGRLQISRNGEVRALSSAEIRIKV